MVDNIKVITAGNLHSVGCKFIKIFFSDPRNLNHIVSSTIWNIIVYGFIFYDFLMINMSIYFQDVPVQFSEKYGLLIPESVKYSVKNGKTFTGVYNHSKQTLYGLHNVFALLDLQQFEVLVFTYYGDGYFEVSALSSACTEKDVPSSDSQLSNTVFLCSTIQFVIIYVYMTTLIYADSDFDTFKIQIQPSHLYKYCHGVVIITYSSKKFSVKYNLPYLHN